MLVEVDSKYKLDISKGQHVIFTSPVLCNIQATVCSGMHFLTENYFLKCILKR